MHPASLIPLIIPTIMSVSLASASGKVEMVYPFHRAMAVDGRCGPYNEWLLCPAGSCCSKLGWCGNTALHCNWCKLPESECPYLPPETNLSAVPAPYPGAFHRVPVVSKPPSPGVGTASGSPELKVDSVPIVRVPPHVEHDDDDDDDEVVNGDDGIDPLVTSGSPSLPAAGVMASTSLLLMLAAIPILFRV